MGSPGPYTEIIKFRTLPIRVAHCGDPALLPEGGPGEPFREAIKGMTIDVDGMEMTLLDVVHLGDGYYQGLGRVRVDYLGGAAFTASFDRIFINTDRQVVLGRIDFVTNGVAVMAEEQLAAQEKREKERKKEANREEWAGTDFYGKIFLFDNIIIEDIAANGPNINITDSEGNIHPNTEVAAILAASPEKAIIIEDKNGDQWVVEKDGDGAKVTKVKGGVLAPGSIFNPADFTIQEKLVVEVLEGLEQKLDSWLDTYGKGPLSLEEMSRFLSLPDDVPKDPEMVEGILKYVNQVKTNPTEFTKKLFEQEGKALNELLKDVEQDQPLKGQLDENQWQQAEKVITKEAVNQGLFKWFTDLPYRERAAKVLKEHLENQGIYDEVWTSESNKTTILTKLSLSADATLEQEIDLTKVSEDELFELLVLTYKVPYWEAYDAELKGWDRVVNWLRIQDAKIARKEGWAVAYANFTADVVNAPAGAVQGWITGEHWRTGQELAWWEHILGIVDVIPGEALAKAGITALVIKIGDKVFDLTKVTTATRNFILASKTAGLKLVVKSTNEIILYSAKGTKEIGRFLNGVLQDIYWVYGGEKVLAKLAGIQYIVDNNTVKGALEIVEVEGKTGLKISGKGVLNGSGPLPGVFELSSRIKSVAQFKITIQKKVP